MTIATASEPALTQPEVWDILKSGRHGQLRGGAESLFVQLTKYWGFKFNPSMIRVRTLIDRQLFCLEYDIAPHLHDSVMRMTINGQTQYGYLTEYCSGNLAGAKDAIYHEMKHKLRALPEPYNGIADDITHYHNWGFRVSDGLAVPLDFSWTNKETDDKHHNMDFAPEYLTV